MMEEDPWQRVRTLHGLPADEVISGLQKSVRRGKSEDAVRFAWEMHASSAELEQVLWQRLLVISVEDIGFGEPLAPVLIQSLNEMRSAFPRSSGDRALFFVHAIRYLCSRAKDRSNDLLLNIIRRESDSGVAPVIEDHMLDMHTRRGQEQSRGMEHFLDTASRVEPLVPGAHDDYLPRLRQLLAEGEQESGRQR